LSDTKKLGWVSQGALGATEKQYLLQHEVLENMIITLCAENVNKSNPFVNKKTEKTEV